MVIAKTSKDLKPYLMDSKARVAKNPYYLIASDEQIIYVLMPGLNSIEYNKTTPSMNNLEGVTLYQCLWGQGILVLQRNDQQGEAKEFKVITLNPGRQVGIPAGWGSSLVNVGKGFLVVLRSGGNEENNSNSQAIAEKRGLAYYIVEKKGEIAFEQNPNYSVHPQITTE